MNILFVAPRFHTNQINVVKALKNAGYNPSFYVLYRGRSEDYTVLTPKQIPYSFLSRVFHQKTKDAYKSLKYLFPSFKAIVRIFKLESPDLLIVRDPFLLSSLMFLLIGKIKGVENIIYTQYPIFGGLSGVKKFLIQIVISVFNAKMISPVLGADNKSKSIRKSYYLPFVADKVECKKENFEKIKILSIGKFYPRKNHLLLLEAVKELLSKYEIQLTIIGENSNAEHQLYLDKIREFIKENKLNSNVFICKNLSYDDVLREYVKHNLFILPSDKEPAAVSVLEAMSFGLPVITSDANGTSCYVKQGINGYVFKTNNIEDLKRKMELILSDFNNLEQFGKESLRIVKEEYSGKKYIERFKEIIKKASNKN